MLGCGAVIAERYINQSPLNMLGSALIIIGALWVLKLKRKQSQLPK